MDCNTRIKNLLKENSISYDAQEHPLAYTAQRVAESEHLSGWKMAKVVMAAAENGGLLMFVIPTPSHLNLVKGAEAAGAHEVALATEAEFASAFPDCDVGAMPPFGRLYDMPTFVDKSLLEQEEIVFQAGSHTETIRMKPADYLRVSGATAADLVKKRRHEGHASAFLAEVQLG